MTLRLYPALCTRFLIGCLAIDWLTLTKCLNIRYHLVFILYSQQSSEITLHIEWLRSVWFPRHLKHIFVPAF